MLENSMILLKEKKILFVDDDSIIRNHMKKLLSLLFKKVIMASHGEEGLIHYEDEKPDIIFTDVQMPRMDGITMATKIRSVDLTTPIIFYSAHNEQKYILKAVNLMVEGYLLKPASIEEMVNIFAQSLRRNIKQMGFLTDLGNNFVYNHITRELFHDAQMISLSPKEESLLKLLIIKHPQTLTKEYVSTEVWPMETVGISAIKNVISRLRNKIGEEKIVAVKGIGWRLNLT